MRRDFECGVSLLARACRAPDVGGHYLPDSRGESDDH